jgi:peptidoglycan hydrolase-like protein with peptidoglycan-binding domain
VPNTDLASHEPWLDSQRRSRGRRFEAVRRLRRQRGRRAGVGVVLASLTLAAGGAVAADGTGGSGSGSGSGAAVQAAGSSVAALQRALGIAADGIYGRQTRRAVRRFQRAHGLTVDGIAGPQTLGALGLSAAGADESRRTTKSSGGNVLARIAQCESGGDPTAISSSGRFRGKYQFTRATWRSMGGTGDPAKASEAEQDQRALALYQARGTAPWPVCGARA